MLINFMAEKIKRIDTAENAVKQRLSRVLEHMNISAGERAVALNTAIWRVRCGGQTKTAEREAVQYAKHREREHAREHMAKWYKLEGNRFVPAWDEPPNGAA